MVRWQPLVIVVLLASVAVAAVWFLRTTEPRRISRQLNRLAERVSKAEGESAALMALKMNALGDLFESSLEVDLADFPGNGTYASTEVASHVARFRPAFRRLALSFSDTQITIATATTADILFTARLVATGENGAKQEDTRFIHAAVRKADDGVWRFARFDEVKVLQR